MAACITGSTSPAEAQSCTPVPSGLVSWWQAEGSAEDAVGGLSGTLSGGVGFAAGKAGQAFSFDGVDDYVQIGDRPELVMSNGFSVEAWIYPTGAGNGPSGGGIIVSKEGEYVIDRISDGTIRWAIAGTGPWDWTATPLVAPLNTWTHVALVYDNGPVKIYGNGSLVQTYSGPTVLGDVYPTLNDFRIGARQAVTECFRGLIDEVAVFKRALTADEIQSIYAAGSAGKCGIPLGIITQPASQTVVAGVDVTFSVAASGSRPLSYQWWFNTTNLIAGATNASLLLKNVQPATNGNYSVVVTNASGSTNSAEAALVVNVPVCVPAPADLVGWWPAEGNADDEVGGLNGTLVGGATFAPGMVGQAFSLDGVDDYVQIGARSELVMSNALTAEAWIFPTGVGSGPASEGIIFNKEGEYEMDRMADGTIRWSIKDPSTPMVWTVTSFVAPVNTWTHVALVYDHGVTKVYGNGSLVQSYNGPNAVGDELPTLNDFRIGGRQYLSECFKGLIDEVAVYQRALTASEIAAIHAARSAGKCQPLTNAPPNIYTQPQDQTVDAGSSAAFSVSVTGTRPFSYQWWWNTTNLLAGATNASYVRSDVQPGQAGAYFVVITNDFGTVTSSNATLKVLTYPPSITTQPTGQTVIVGAAVSFRVTATGTAPLAYQWFQNTTRLDNATNSTLNLSNVALSRAGDYHVQVTNSYGSIDSSNATLVVVDLGPNFFDDFELGIHTLQWSGFSSTVKATNYGGAVSGTNSLWFGGSGSRYAVTRPLNTTAGAIVQFYLRLAKGTSTTWETVDLPSKGVVLEYSVGGGTWTQLARYDTTPYTNWTFCTLTVPTAAQAPGTSFRWRQLSNSGSAYDHWALDDVAVIVGPFAEVRVASTAAAGGGVATVPVALVANGNENALGFSLAFDTNRLSFAGVALGSGAPGASLIPNTTQTGSGKLGVAVALPAGATFAAGTQEVVTVSFATAVLTNATSTTITFGDAPSVRQVSDAHASPLAATYTSGTVSIAAVNVEGDLAPRPAGDKAVTITDWVQEGLFVARLEFPTNSGEFQRADCAPRDTQGDGRLTVTDWVQAGRYAAGLDPLTVAGGPTGESPLRLGLGKSDSGGVHLDGVSTCLVRVVNTTLIQGQAGVVQVSLEGSGTESALGFSLGFDPAVLGFTGATLGSAATGATLNVNTNQVAAGKVGLSLMMMPFGSRFAAGSNEVLLLGLQVSPAASGSTVMSFGDIPVPKEVSDTNALAESASYVNGTITIRPLLPSLTIARADDQVRLSWPDWATNYVLQTSDTLATTDTWPEAGVTSTITNGENMVTLPTTNQVRFYRLLKK